MADGKDEHFWDATRKPWMDLENERRPIRPLKSSERKIDQKGNAGSTNQKLAGFFQDMVMEKAIDDRVAQFARVETPETVQISLNENEGSVLDEIVEEIVDDDIESIRARRLLEMKKAFTVQTTLRGLGHGEYNEIVETEFLNVVLKSKYVVVHFYHDEFIRCKSVDKNLSKIASSLIGVRFVKINSEKTPFFVNKLLIKVLPTILYFINGKTVHRIIGFEELGGNQDFKIKNFVQSLKDHDMLGLCDEEEYGPKFLNQTKDEEE